MRWRFYDHRALGNQPPGQSLPAIGGGGGLEGNLLGNTGKGGVTGSTGGACLLAPGGKGESRKLLPAALFPQPREPGIWEQATSSWASRDGGGDEHDDNSQSVTLAVHSLCSRHYFRFYQYSYSEDR